MRKIVELNDRMVAVTTLSPNGPDLFAQMKEWTNKIAERAFSLFQDRGSVHGHDWEDWFTAESELLRPVTLDIQETEEIFLINAEVPGFQVGDLEVQLDDFRLVIHGLHRSDQGAKGEEAVPGSAGPEPQQIYRIVELSIPVAIDKVQAELSNGVLQLTLPKLKEPASG